MHRNRALPKTLRTRPESDTEGRLELRERDGVTETPTGEQVLDRGAVQPGVTTDGGQRPALEGCVQATGEAVGDDSLEGRVDVELPLGEGRGGVGEEVDGPAVDPAAPGHAGDATDGTDADVRSNARSPILTAGKNQQAGKGAMASERDKLIGQRVHALVAAYLRSGKVPTSREVWVAASKVFNLKPLPQNAACRQRAACAVSAYFSMFHRPDWEFLGAEVALGTGRVDIVWELSPEGLVVIDEVKVAGFSDQVDEPATVAQLERYCEAGARVFGERFAGVRLLPLAAPGRALWCSPDGLRVKLSEACEEVA
jgi:hypothetical protein